MATRKGSSSQACLVKLEYMRLLLPVEQGLAVMKLLQNAVLCDRKDGDEWPPHYILGEQPRLEFELIKGSRLEMAEPKVTPVSRRRKHFLLEE